MLEQIFVDTGREDKEKQENENILNEESKQVDGG